MGFTNVRKVLEAKYRAWLTEKHTLDRQIEAIQKANATLEEKQGRVDRLDDLLGSIRTIMSEVAPTWDADEMAPRRQNTTSLPFEPTEMTRWSLEALRDAGESLRTRDIADRLVARKKLDPKDHELVARIRHSVDSVLRSMQKRGYVSVNDDFPARWSIVVADPKPLRRRGPGPSTRSDMDDAVDQDGDD